MKIGLRPGVKPTGLGRLAVYLAGRELAQLLVGRFFLAQRLLEETACVAEAELVGPGRECAVARDLVVLHGLRRRDQAGIERLAALELVHDRLAFLEDAQDRLAGLAARGLAE